MDSQDDVGRRWADGLRQAAATAYASTHGTTVPEAPSPRPTRWHVDARTAATAAIAIVILGAWAWWGLRPDDGEPVAVSPAPAPAQSSAQASPGTVVVHVSGEVGSPGLVELPGGSRVADAVDRAGGLSAEADEGSVNLARPVADGEHVIVGGVGDAEGAGPINVNAADASALEALPGVGPVLAARIVADREASGPFLTLDDLARVSGVGPALIAGLADVATT